jgi:quercetin dioxygenase-like cupin family protein
MKIAQHSPWIAAAVAAALAASPAAFADTTVAPKANLAWTAAGVPGVSTAAVRGNMSKGPSHFYLKYAAGFSAPVHHHSADHYVTTISGTLVLVVDGKEHRLEPGSFFAFTRKAKHAGRCEGSDDCVMFVDARGAWDVVPAAKP